MEPRVVVVTRPTVYSGLLARHGTHGQAAWFLERQGEALAGATPQGGLDGLVADHEAQLAAVETVWRAIPSAWRCTRIDRADLDRFLFEPEDLVVAIGQDGLVANVAKYLDDQLVLGVNPGGYPGVLVRFSPRDAAKRLPHLPDNRGRAEVRTRVEAVTDDGQRLLALNEIFVGHRTHQSARYRLQVGAQAELHSSSGLIVSTGTGSTGWAKSIAATRGTAVPLPSPAAPVLVYYVREPWLSPTTQAGLVQGQLTGDGALVVDSRMQEGGVCFGDGIESDAIELPYARRITVRRAERGLHLA